MEYEQPTYERQSRCVSYTQAHSADRDGVTDLHIGHAHTTVSCGSSSFGGSKPGDYVLISGTRGKSRFFTIGVIIAPIVACDIWAQRGGKIWPHNFEYRPLTEIHEVTPTLKKTIAALCEKHSVSATTFFNPMGHGRKYIPVIRDLVMMLTGTSTAHPRKSQTDNLPTTVNGQTAACDNS